jgi:hypothetical protein
VIAMTLDLTVGYKRSSNRIINTTWILNDFIKEKNMKSLVILVVSMFFIISCDDDSSSNNVNNENNLNNINNLNNLNNTNNLNNLNNTNNINNLNNINNINNSSACLVFPADNPWNQDISSLPVHSNSDNFIASIGLDGNMHADFGTTWQGVPNGIPSVEVDSNTSLSSVGFNYADESDSGPYPIPANAPIEGGPDGNGDRHIIMVDLENCMLYELFNAWPPGQGDNPSTTDWYAGSGAIFDLSSNSLRPDGWTSADAAGLPIYPGLVRYEEVMSGVIKHALRFTVSQSQHAYIHPATHFASSNTDSNLPPMGLRLRLKADFDISTFSTEVQVILTALKTYGMFVADNGSNWYLSGSPNESWDDDALHELHNVPGSAFEVVDTGQQIVTQ